MVSFNSTLKIKTLIQGFFYAAILALLLIFGLDYYTLRTQHMQVMGYLIQPVKLTTGEVVQRAEALDRLLPKETVTANGSTGGDSVK